MARYRLIIEGYVDIETPRSPAQVRTAFIETLPTFRESVKTALRGKVALDGSGETVILEWVLHTDNITPLDGGPEIDLDEGLTEETEV